MLLSFDREKIASDIRAEAAKMFTEAIANADSPGDRQFLEAQYSMLDASIIQLTVFAEMLGAGMKFTSVVKLMAAHCGTILSTCMAQVQDDARPVVMELFLSQLHAAVEGPHYGSRISVAGTPGGAGMTFLVSGDPNSAVRIKSFSSSTRGEKSTIRIELECSDLWELGFTLRALVETQKSQREKPAPPPKPEKPKRQQPLALPAPQRALPAPAAISSEEE